VKFLKKITNAIKRKKGLPQERIEFIEKCEKETKELIDKYELS